MMETKDYSSETEVSKEVMENEDFQQQFKLANSKYGDLEKYKAANRERIDQRFPQSVISQGMITIKSDDTGHVLIEDSNAKGCQDKKGTQAEFSTEQYTTAHQAENAEFNNANLNAVESLAPFKLRRVYGRQEKVAALNLTGIYRNHIAYATSNVVIIYDYVENSQHCMQGHRNTIKSLVIESHGRFIISTDAGRRSLIIIWETMTGKPVRFIPEVHDKHGSIFACFTGVDYIFASIGAQEIGKQTLCFWNFDLKNSSNIPLATEKFPNTTSVIRELSFLENRPEFFAATGDRNVVFGTWIRDKKGDSIYMHKPRLRKAFITKHKRFTSSLWMRDGEWLATATGAGYVCIWGPPVVLALEDPPDPSKNIKEFQRAFKLCEDGITVFTINNDYVVIGDEIGIVRFFDHEFKLLRWSKNFDLPAIQSISFNLTDAVPEFKKNFQAGYDGRTKGFRLQNSRVRDYTLGGKKARQLSKTTLPRPPMPCPDFVIGVKGGNVYYYHFNEMQLDLLVTGTPGQFVTCDVCPGSNHIVFSTRKGEIQMYEFKTHQLVFNERIFSGNHFVNTMKFNPLGNFVIFGLTDGHLCFRRNYTWTSYISPLTLTKDPVVRIIATGDGLHTAYYDDKRTVVAIKFLPKAKSFLVLGKSRGHKKDIADIQFFNDPDQGDRLFSLGLDRHLIEYDLERSSEETGLFIVKIVNLEQTCRPTAMVFDGPPEFGIDCITFSNDINKIRLFSYKEEKVKMTCSGPVFGRETGIKRMVEFPLVMSEDRTKKFIVYIVRNKLGLMDTPLDGNPHKYMAVFTHPREIIEVAVVPEKERIFTVGKDDDSAFVWEASPRAMEATVLMGGSGVTPFYHTLRRHWGGACQDIIKDLDMIFFFLNVKRIDKQVEIYTMNRKIRISEIPAVCRACGFYPTEYEVSLMIDEARRLKMAKQHYTDDTSTEISFDEFIKLFVNHFYRVTDEDVEEAFKTLGFTDEDEEPYICRRDFITYLTQEGEAFSPHNFPIYFEPMYDIQEPNQYGEVQCHTFQAEQISSSSSSYSSTYSVSKEAGKEESFTSTSSSFSDEEEEEEEEREVDTELEEVFRKNSDEQGQEQSEIRKSEEQEINDEAGNDEEEMQQQETGKTVKKSMMRKKQKGVKSTKSIKIEEEIGAQNSTKVNNDNMNEFDFGDHDGSEFEGEGARILEDDLTDIPERIDLTYFLNVMVPAHSQQAIRWKPQTDKDQTEEIKQVAVATRKKQETEFLNTLLKQIVDPTFPIPRKLLNALLAEYYLDHGNFSVPSDLRYPGIGLPDDSWYKDDDDEEEEFTPRKSSILPGTPSKDAELENQDAREAPAGYEEFEGEGADLRREILAEGRVGTIESYKFQESAGEQSVYADAAGTQLENATSTQLENATSTQLENAASTQLENAASTQLENAAEEYEASEGMSSERYGEDGAYSPPFSMSEAPPTADLIMRDDISEDGTEAMTDLDNAYEEEDLEFVRNVNQSFRPVMDDGDE